MPIMLLENNTYVNAIICMPKDVLSTFENVCK